MSFCSLIKAITPNIRVLCFVLINSPLLNLWCVWIAFHNRSWLGLKHQFTFSQSFHNVQKSQLQIQSQCQRIWQGARPASVCSTNTTIILPCNPKPWQEADHPYSLSNNWWCLILSRLVFTKIESLCSQWQHFTAERKRKKEKKRSQTFRLLLVDWVVTYFRDVSHTHRLFVVLLSSAFWIVS